MQEGCENYSIYTLGVYVACTDKITHAVHFDKVYNVEFLLTLLIQLKGCDESGLIQSLCGTSSKCLASL